MAFHCFDPQIDVKKPNYEISFSYSFVSMKSLLNIHSYLVRDTLS